VVAAALLGAKVLRAGVLVVAKNWVADTCSGFAMVCHGAGIVILAFTLVEGHILAPFLCETAIIGALVAVVTGCLVDRAVAIIVEAVANLLGGDQGVAFEESFLCTDALSFAETVLIFHCAWGPERKGN